MMKKMNLKILLLATILIFSSLACYANKKSLEDFFIASNSKNLLSELNTLEDMSSDGQWILILVNYNLYESKLLLDYLKNNFIQEKNILIIALGHKSEDYSFNMNSDLNNIKWMNVKGSSILDFFEVNATPIIIGMRNNIIMWKITGFNNESDFLSGLIESWTLK